MILRSFWANLLIIFTLKIGPQTPGPQTRNFSQIIPEFLQEIRPFSAYRRYVTERMLQQVNVVFWNPLEHPKPSKTKHNKDDAHDDQKIENRTKI